MKVCRRLLFSESIEIVHQQSERGGGLRYASQEDILRTCQARSKLRFRETQHEKISRRPVDGLKRVSQRDECGLAVIKDNLLPALVQQERPFRIHDQADVVGRV